MGAGGVENEGTESGGSAPDAGSHPSGTILPTAGAPPPVTTQTVASPALAAAGAQAAAGSVANAPALTSGQKPQNWQPLGRPEQATAGAVPPGQHVGGVGHEEAAEESGELTRLRREVRQLRQENQNVAWLADEVRRLRGQLSHAQAAAK